VAKAEGFEHIIESEYDKQCMVREDEYGIWEVYSPTTNPSQAWPIIERGISINYYNGDYWQAEIDGDTFAFGKTSLEAAMRAYVALKFGDEVEL
jgi:hypothetical protein